MDSAAILALIRELDFPRFAGSEGERHAQEMVAAWLREAGVEATLEWFPAPWVQVAEASISVAAESRPLFPIEELMQQTAVWGPPPRLDVAGTLRSVEDAASAEGGTALVVVHRDPSQTAAALKGHAAQLFLFEEAPSLHPYAVSVDPPTPPAYVRPDDWQWVLARLGDTARVQWESMTASRTFANLRADIPGKSAETILLGAHLGSFPGTPGSSDNAFGSALLVELARWYAQHLPARSLRFWWFTGEEIDRRGSQAGAAFELAEEPRALLFLNFDSGVSDEHGEPSIVRVTGGKHMVAWVEGAVAGLADPPEVTERYTEAADVQPFWEAGFATLFPHSTRMAHGPYPHLPTDNPDTISAERVARLSEIDLALVEAALANPPPPTI